MKGDRCRRWAMLALLVAWAHASIVLADDGLLASMREGGNVLLVRHAATVAGVGDPPGFVIDDCSTQRNLSDLGREDARRLGESLRAEGIPVAEVRSSRWCRSLETARLAFAPILPIVPWQPLDSFFADRSERAVHVRNALAHLPGLPHDSNWVWVTHHVNIAALAGEHVVPGEVVVTRPEKGALRVLGKWRPR